MIMYASQNSIEKIDLNKKGCQNKLTAFSFK